MTLSPNKLLACLAVGLVALSFLLLHGHSSSQAKKQDTNVSAQTTPSDNASGDTNAESLKELTAEYQKVEKQNAQYQQTITHLLQQKTPEIKSSPDRDAMQQSQKQLQQQLQTVQQQLAELQQTNLMNAANSDNGHYPIQAASGMNTSPNSGMITVVTDSSVSIGENVSPIKPRASFISTTPSTYKSHTTAQRIPVYTIPSLSNLANTVLMTSLIGEVPQGNTFEQPPFPFTALVGKKDLLAANGFHLPPHLAGMKLGGYSVGVGSFVSGLACVRSYVTQITFIFDDGHIVTQGHAATNGEVNPSDALGYLSDPYGNPCMPGEYKSNAARVLTMLTGVSMVEGVGDGLSQAQTNTLTGFDGTTTVFNGSIGKYAVGTGLSNSMDKATQYALDRLKGTFDVVYIPASQNGKPTPIVANFTKNIAIDYNPTGREIDYETNKNSVFYRSSLD